VKQSVPANKTVYLHCFRDSLGSQESKAEDLLQPKILEEKGFPEPKSATNELAEDSPSKAKRTFSQFQEAVSALEAVLKPPVNDWNELSGSNINYVIRLINYFIKLTLKQKSTITESMHNEIRALAKLLKFKVP